MIEKGTYRHFKGDTYRLLMIVTHSETLEDMVVYEKLSNSTLWVRPLSMWTEAVELNGEKVPRFKLIERQEKGKNEV